MNFQLAHEPSAGTIPKMRPFMTGDVPARGQTLFSVFVPSAASIRLDFTESFPP